MPTIGGSRSNEEAARHGAVVTGLASPAPVVGVSLPLTSSRTFEYPIMRSHSSRSNRCLATRRLRTFGLALTLGAGLAATSLAAQEAAETEASTDLFLRANKVIVSPGKTLEGVSLIVRDGRIIAMGDDLAAPEGAQTIEGEVICAAFIDPWSVAGVDASSAGTDRVDTATRATDALDPYRQDELLEDLVESGVLMMRVEIGRSAAVSGVGAVIRAAGAEPVLSDAALTARLDSPGLDPVSRVGQVDRLASALTAAQKYAADVAVYERDLKVWKEEIAEKEKELAEDFKKAKKARDKKVKEAEEDGEELKEKKYKEDKRPRAPKLDPKKASLARAVGGEVPMVVHVEQALELRELLRVTRGFTRMRMVIAGGRSALLFADELAERGIPVIVTPSPGSPGGDVGEMDPGFALAGELSARGVEVLIGSGATSASASVNLPLLAAAAVGHGLGEDAALHAITRGPARVFDLQAKVGTVKRGLHADLLVLSGDPLSSSTRVLASISGGKVVHQAGN